jgi:hypothetical protein
MNEIPTDPSVLRAEIAQTRAELGDTVEALAAKIDVKARMEDAARDAKQRVREVAGAANGRVRDLADLANVQVVRAKDQVSSAVGPRWPVMVASALAVVAALAGLEWWRRRG